MMDARGRPATCRRMAGIEPRGRNESAKNKRVLKTRALRRRHRDAFWERRMRALGMRREAAHSELNGCLPARALRAAQARLRGNCANFFPAGDAFARRDARLFGVVTRGIGGASGA